MKTAVILDPQKINRLKSKIEKKSYIDNAINQLAYEIAWIFA